MSGTIFFKRSSNTIITFLPIFLFSLVASAGASQYVTISWYHSAPAESVSAYRFYQDNLLLCETLDPLAREITCPAVFEGDSVFAVTAVYWDEGEVVPPVAPVNTQPFAQNLAVSLNEDGSVASFLSASDLENDPLNYQIVTGPTSGVLSLTDQLTGEYLYTPNNNVSGSDSFTYLANDGSLDSASATVSLTILPVNDAPVAEAGVGQSIPEGQPGLLDATGSTDIDDGIASYSWTQLSGPVSVLSDSSAMQPTITTPEVGVNGAVLTYELTVTDQGGLQSKDSVSISVTNKVIVNRVPFAFAIETSVEEDGTVYDSLNGVDADGDALTYTIISDASTGLVELLNINTGEFRYLSDRNVSGEDSFLYSVSDGKDVSNIAVVTITVLPVNDAPVASAGSDQVVNEGETVTLDATNSYDVDDQFLTVSWTQLDGPTVSLSDSLAIQPQFEAIDIGMDSVTLTFQLTVTDAQGLEATDVSSVNIVWVNTPPLAVAGADQTVFENDTVVLDATQSTDNDDGIASYLWVQTAGPEMLLSDSTSMQPSFSAPNVSLEGASMTYEVMVTDFGGLYNKDSVIVNISWINTPPVANAGIDQIVTAGEVVTLDGSLSDDEDDGIATIQWSQKTGEPVTLSDPTAMQPVFVAPAYSLETETLTFELIVTDYSGLQHTDNCSIEVKPVEQTSIPTIIGDLDGDGDLDSKDKAIFKRSLSTCVGDTRYLESADLNGDTCVTFADYRLWSRLP